ncbi:hypothetical protein DFAR_1760012 [Desulfarculales bacterium]
MQDGKICVTRRLPQAGLDLLAQVAELVVFPLDQGLTRAELLELLRDLPDADLHSG